MRSVREAIKELLGGRLGDKWTIDWLRGRPQTTNATSSNNPDNHNNNSGNSNNKNSNSNTTTDTMTSDMDPTNMGMKDPLNNVDHLVILRCDGRQLLPVQLQQQSPLHVQVGGSHRIEVCRYQLVIRMEVLFIHYTVIHLSHTHSLSLLLI